VSWTTTSPAALVASCGRCGAGTLGSTAFCTGCGVALGPTRPSPVDLFTGVAPAAPRRRALSLAVDLVVVLASGSTVAGIVLSSSLAAGRHPEPGAIVLLAVVVSVVVSVVLARATGRTGRSVGARAAGLRTVSSDDATPVAVGTALSGRDRTPSGTTPTGATSPGVLHRWRGTLAADLRAGRDPVDRPAPPVRGPLRSELATAPSAHAEATSPLEATVLRPGRGPAEWSSALGDVELDLDSVVLRFDTGDLERFVGAAVVGRNPSGSDGVVPVAVPDLTRTLSKSHLTVERTGTGAVVADLGSTNGTEVTDPEGASARVVPGAPVPIRSGTTITAGDHRFTVWFVDEQEAS
jgi:hypothetical protein